MQPGISWPSVLESAGLRRAAFEGRDHEQEENEGEEDDRRADSEQLGQSHLTHSPDGEDGLRT